MFSSRYWAVTTSSWMVAAVDAWAFVPRAEALGACGGWSCVA
jgi:hypothetical protein